MLVQRRSQGVTRRISTSMRFHHFGAVICCAALQLQPVRRPVRTKCSAAVDEDVWADGGSDDVDLEGLDDVDALDLYKKRAAAFVQVCDARGIAPARVCVVASSEAAAVIAHGAGFRRFATDTVAKAATLAGALPKNATFLTQVPRKGPRDGKAAAFLKKRLVFERYRPGAQKSTARARTKVSASRRKFLDKRDAAKDRGAKPEPRALASPAEVLAALDAEGADGIGGVIGPDAAAAVAAASKLSDARPDELFGLVVLLRDAFDLDETFDVWPLLDIDDAALDELLGELSGEDDSDVEFESIRVPGGRS